MQYNLTAALLNTMAALMTMHVQAPQFTRVPL